MADSGRLEEAVSAYAFATNHPMIANSVWYEDVAGKVVQAAGSKLESQTINKARRRGMERNPAQMSEELLEIVDEIAAEY